MTMPVHLSRQLAIQADAANHMRQRDADLHILSHAQVVALLARLLTPDERCDGAEEAHEQLHANDQPNLEVEETVI